jgi:predicted aspartyl protease
MPTSDFRPTFGSDGIGAYGRNELLRLAGPHIPVIVRAPRPVEGYAEGDFVQLDALIDTGASDICIDIKTARRLGLHAVDTTFIGGIGGSVESVVFADVLEVPNLQFRRVVRMFSPKDVVLSSKMLLGRSFLENFIMTYDGPNDMFHFYNPHVGLSGPIDDE